MEKIIVTGGAGFIGSHLVDKLKKGYDVRVLDRKVLPYVNLSCYDIVKDYFARMKPTVVFDLASIPLWESLVKPYYVPYQIYCMGANLCELQREGYFKTLIHVSSSEVYGTANTLPMTEVHTMMPCTPYAAGKAAQDMLMISYNRTFQSEIAIGRPFNTYGPRGDLNAIIPATIKAILAGKKPTISGSGQQTRDFIYVSDTVDGILEIWKQKEKCFGRILNIAKGSPITINELVDKICKLMKYKGKIQYTKPRAGDVHMHFCNPFAIKQILGWEARVELDEGLKRTVEWWKDSM